MWTKEIKLNTYSSSIYSCSCWWYSSLLLTVIRNKSSSSKWDRIPTGKPWQLDHPLVADCGKGKEFCAVEIKPDIHWWWNPEVSPGYCCLNSPCFNLYFGTLIRLHFSHCDDKLCPMVVFLVFCCNISVNEVSLQQIKWTSVIISFLPDTFRRLLVVCRLLTEIRTSTSMLLGSCMQHSRQW